MRLVLMLMALFEDLLSRRLLVPGFHSHLHSSDDTMRLKSSPYAISLFCSIGADAGDVEERRIRLIKTAHVPTKLQYF